MRFYNKIVLKNQNQWTNFEYNDRPKGVEAEIQYGIEYEWGALHVTKNAHQAYNLVPLVEGVKSGDGIKLDPVQEYPIRTDIYLLEPDEYIDLATEGALPKYPYMTNDGMGATILHKGGMEIILGLKGRTDAAVEHAKNNIPSFTRNLGIPLDDNEVMDQIEQEMPQLALNYLCNLAKIATENSADEYVRADMAKKAMRVTKYTGALAIMGTSTMLAVGLANDGKIDSFEALAAVGFLSGLEIIRNTPIKAHLKYTNERERKMEAMTGGYGNIISNDIYKTYSAEHFNKQAEAMLRED